MPKGPKKHTIYFNPSPFDLALLLVKIALVKIGNAPLFVLRILLTAVIRLLKIIPLLFNFFLLLVSMPFKIRLPKLHWRHPAPKITTGFQLDRLRRNRGPGRPKKFKMSRGAKIALTLTLFLIFLSGYTVFILTAAYALPTPTKLASPDEPLTTQIYDRNGTLLYRFYEGKNRYLVNLSDIPKTMVQATLAIEDQNFYHHIGVDFPAIIRAFYHNLRNGSEEGGSTITQQLIKNSLLTPEKTYTRKIREIILAIWAERTYTKDQILQMYFNEAPYGGTNVGISAAAQTYFGKLPSELDLAESAYLAGLPVSPTQFSPYGEHPELAKNRQKEVLDRMAKVGYISEPQAMAAFAKNLDIKPLANDILAPHFVFYIRNLLIEKFGARAVVQGGLKIYTTLDLKIQEQTEKIVKAEVDKLANLNVQNGAAMVMDATNGQILAMVGSRDYHYPEFGNFNSTLSLRQPGSSVKPITYATAFKNGFNPNSIILDVPVVFKDEWGNSYAPVNYDGRFRGPVTLRQALGSSLNIPAVKLLATVGIDQVAQTAKDLGITTWNNPERFGLSLTLGGAEVKMIDMVGAYGAFARNGILHQPTGILKVTDSKNQVLDEFKDNSSQALSPQIAYLITHILADDDARKMAFGPKSLLYIPGYEVAVKTGTSDNKRDNWTFGFTPKYVVGVWVGNPNNSPMNPSLTSGITGAAPIWNKIMTTLLTNSPALAFERPSEITEVVASGKHELSQTGIIPKAMVRIQRKDDKLIFSDSFSSFATSSAQAATLPNL